MSFIMLKVIYDLFQAVMNNIKELFMNLTTKGDTNYISKAGTEQVC